MTNKEIFKNILGEIDACLSRFEEDEICRFEEEISSANRIFVAGAGRALMMIRPMAMRLMHFGLITYVVGETCTPAICSGDLLIIASGSGCTGSLTVMAKKCKEIGARLALITTATDSTIGLLSDCIVHVKTSTCKRNEETEDMSIQPGANAFEQCVHILGDVVTIKLFGGGDIIKENEILMRRHANLE